MKVQATQLDRVNCILHRQVEHILFVNHTVHLTHFFCIAQAGPITNLTLYDLDISHFFVIEICTQAHDVNDIFLIVGLIHLGRHVNDAVFASRGIEYANVLLESPLKQKVASRPSFEQKTFAVVDLFEAGILELSYDGCKGHVLVEVGGFHHLFALVKWNVLLHVSQEVITGASFVHVGVYKLIAFEDVKRFRVVINERTSKLFLKHVSSEAFPRRFHGTSLWTCVVTVTTALEHYGNNYNNKHS